MLEGECRARSPLAGRPTALMMAAFSAVDLASASVEELRGVLADHDVLVAKALQELEDLEQAPRFYAERLARLERYFADLRAGDSVRLVDPQLKAETEALRKAMGLEPKRDYMNRPHLDHEEDHAEGRFFAAGGNVAAHVEHEEFVLGKGYLPLDHNALNYRRAHNARVQNYHPTVDAVHFAGCLRRSPENVHALFATPGGHAEHRPLTVPDPQTTFWLERPWAPASAAEEDPVLFGQERAQPVPPTTAAQSDDERPHHQEPLPVDWLGLARRGVPADGLGEAP